MWCVFPFLVKHKMYTLTHCSCRHFHAQVAVVHVGESTLKKRVSEFEYTDSSSLTSSEFERWARELEHELDQRLHAVQIHLNRFIETES